MPRSSPRPAHACAEASWATAELAHSTTRWPRNLRWLAGYRHPRFDIGEIVRRLRATFAIPRPLLAGAEVCGPPTSVLLVLFGRLWRWQRRTDLATPLSESSIAGCQGR